jgi:antitoxin component of MazEF toxin-antitoxin module
MKWDRIVRKFGNSLSIAIPPDVLKYLVIDEGTEIVLEVKEGKYGKYVAFWKKEDTVTSNETI